VFPSHDRRGFNRVKAVKFPVMTKQETTITATAGAAHTAYLIHTTHPIRRVLEVLSMAMIHKFYQQNKFWISNWDMPAGMISTSYAAMTPGTYDSPNMQVQAVLQRRVNDTGDFNPTNVKILETSLLSSNFTWRDMAEQMADKLVALVTDESESLFISHIQWKSNDVANMVIPAQLWDATELYITITGNSILQVQNRTAAGDANAQTTSIEANPIVGKEYMLTGNNARIRDYTVLTDSNSQQLCSSADTGMLEFGSDSSELSTAFQNALKQPPLGNYFFNCKGTRRIRLEPGAIRRSSAYKSITKTLNQWLRGYYNALSEDNVTTRATIREFVTTGVGVSKLLAMEKVANMGSASVEYSGERDFIMKAKAFIKKRSFTVPYNV